MKAKNENGQIVIYIQLPNSYGNVQNGYASLTERHELDGFLDLIIPELLDNEVLGEVYQVENYFTYHKIYVEPKTPEELQEIQNSKIALHEMYPELNGMNYQLLQLDNLPNIERLEPMSDKGLKGIKNYVKDGVLIWSIESKFWFEADAEFSEGVIKTARIYDLGGRVVDSWVKRVRLSEDDKEYIRKVQRERILTYFKSQQSTLYNFLHIFFKNEIQDYIVTGDKEKFEAILLNAKDNHPFQDENGNYIVRLTLNSEVTTQSGGMTTVINGILNELV